MYSQSSRPKWWQVYLTLPLLVALSVVDSRLKISTRGHQAVQIGILILVYGFIYLWLKANGSALSKMDQPHYSGRIRIVQIPWKPIADSTDTEPAARLSPSVEIKGVLSDTFEMDYIDAQALPAEESSSLLEKE